MGAVKRVCPLFRPRERALPTFPLFLLGCAFFAVAAFAGDTILPGEGISGNETLVSKNGEFELGFFSPGDNIHFFLGVRFKKMPSTSPNFWVGNRVPITDLSASALEVFGGSLCIKEAGASLWCSSGVAVGPSPPAAAAVLLDNGNLVVMDRANSFRILWQSLDYPGDSLLPGARLGFDRDTGSNISMTYEHYPNNGSISVDQSRRNGFVLTTDGLDSLGTFPDWMVTSQDNGSSLVLNRPNPNVTEFLQLHLGQVSLKRWSEDSAAANRSGWVARWTFPSDCKSSGFFCAAQVNEGNVLCLLDSRLEGNANVKELDITCRVACWCIQDEKDDRPSIGQVVRMLEGVVNTEIPPIPSSFENLMEGENSCIYSDEG
uniref:non-specific serine/threonine protein kinase n=1 Tax=Setaria italica TaxID=4555 RepID=K3XS64_SETIT